MTINNILMDDFTLGELNAGQKRFNFPDRAIKDGLNLELANGGFTTRAGTSLMSDGSLPAGEVQALYDVRFPTNEVSYRVAQIKHLFIFEEGGTGPLARSGHTAVWDTGNGRMLIFGGENDLAAYYNDLWAYDPDTKLFTEITPTGGPPTARSDHSAIYVPSLEIMVIFGGGSAGGLLNDVWVLDCQTDTWSEQATAGSVPTARSGHRAIYRTATSEMVVLLGENSDTFYYSLDLTTWVWASTETTVAPADAGQGWPFFGGAAVVYDSVNDAIITAGGTDTVETNSKGTYYLPFSSTVWVKKANMPVAEWVPWAAGVYCSGNMYVTGDADNFGGSPDLYAWAYNVAGNTWSNLVWNGTTLPPNRFRHSMCLDDIGQIIVFGGVEQTITGLSLNDVWHTKELCSATGDYGYGLYASSDHLPTETGTFTQIYEFTSEPGVCTFYPLLDRLIITEGQSDRPLTWPGAMANDASDWPHPKQVIVTLDGARYYDIGREVCDRDPDTVADVANIRPSGHIDICLDVPKVSALYIEMGTPNSGLPVEAQVFDQSLLLNDATEITRHDLKAGIVQWYKDGAGVGHFEGAEIDIDAGPAVDKGAGLVGIPSTGHGITSPTGKRIRIEGTINYNAIEVLDASTSANELVITAPYVAETFNVGTEKARQCLTLGAAKDCPDVVPGMSVAFAASEIAIVSQTGDGDDASGVTLASDHVTANVTAAYGLVIQDATLTVNSVAAGSMADSFTKTLDGNPFVAPMTLNLRQVIKASDITTSGDYIEVTFDCSGSASTSTQYNAGFYLIGATIVERATTTGNGTAVPTPLVDATVQLSGATTHTTGLTKFTIDETKDYLVCSEYAVWQNYPSAPRVVPSGPDAGKTYSLFLKQKLEGGGYYFKQDVYNYAKSPANDRLLQTMPAGYTDMSAYAATIGVSKIRVHTARSASAALHVATTTDANQVSLWSADSFVGITAAVTAAGTSKAFIAVSLDDRATLQTYSAGWRSIVKFDAVWKYKDAGGAWQAATVNSLLGAWRQAAAIAQNQMTAAQLGAITQAQWIETGGFVAKVTQYVDFAVALQIGASGEIPSVTSFTVTFNDTGTVVIEGFSGGGWTEGEGWTDGTLVGGVPLGQSGIIAYDGAEPMELDYTVIDGVPGHYLRIRTAGTAPGTEITRIKYQAPCQPLANISSGQPDIASVIFVDASTGAEMDCSSRLANGNLSVAGAIAIPMQVGDYLYWGNDNQFDQIEPTPYADPTDTTFTNNQAASVQTYEYWNGLAWTELVVVDGTDLDGACLAVKGRISWPLPADWHRCIPFDSFHSRGYWVRGKVSVNLTSTFALSEARVYAVPEALKKHRLVTGFLNRVVLLDRMDAPDQADVSRELEEYGFCSQGFASLRLGGTDAIISAVEAWDSVIIGKPTTLHQLSDAGDGTFRIDTVEATRHTPVNSQSIVKAPVSGIDGGDRYGLYFGNREGMFIMTGLHTDRVYNTSRGKTLTDNFWDQKLYPHIELGQLHRSQGVYFPPKNWIVIAVPIRWASTDPAPTTNTGLIIFDLTIQGWLPPVKFTGFDIASLCVAYHYDANSRGHIGEAGLYGGTYDGSIVRLFDPAETTDLTVAIPWFAKWGYLSYGQPDTEKVIRTARLYGRTDAAAGVDLTITGLLLRDDDTVENEQTVTFTRIAGATEPGIDFQEPDVKGNVFEYLLEGTEYMEIEAVEIGIAGLRNWPPLG